MIQPAPEIQLEFAEDTQPFCVVLRRGISLSVQASDRSWPSSREFIEYTISSQFRQDMAGALLLEVQEPYDFPRFPVIVTITLSLPHSVSEVFASRSILAAKLAVELVLRPRRTQWRYKFEIGDPGLDVVITDAQRDR